jgi:prepilin-type processing-associated H-X9-DG protein
LKSRFVIQEDPAFVDLMYTSYAGSSGTRNVEPFLHPLDGVTHKRYAQFDGIFVPDKSIRSAEVTDGTSNTLYFAERAHDELLRRYKGDEYVFRNFGWWGDATCSDTRFWTMFPINPWKQMEDYPEYGFFPAFTSAASSFHPGGAHFAFGDGSVRFLKETISTWEANPTTGYPLGITFDDNGFYHVDPNICKPGVYQALSTRAGDEVVSAGAY